MAAGSLLALFDDIATILDDVSVMTKIAAKKTAGVLGDDLALNAEQVAGVRAERELPVVWAVAKGSFLNKLILVPAALLISVVAPWLITPLLMLGGAYLCFEGFEKIAHRWLYSKEEDYAKHRELVEAVSDPQVDMVEFEKNKIKGAIRTDFILSAEIIVISLGVVKNSPFATQVATVSFIALAITVIVYGLVGGIVKMDDAGLHLVSNKESGGMGSLKRGVGRALLSFAPWLMKSLSVIGTAAMFLVGGGILAHGIYAVHHWIEAATEWVAHSAGAASGVLAFLTPSIANGVFGVIAGGVLVVLFTMGMKILGKSH